MATHHGIHPEEGNLRHQKSQPTAAMPPEMDEADDPAKGLRLLATQDLRERARGLAIGRWDALSRDELIAALAKYKNERRSLSPG